MLSRHKRLNLSLEFKTIAKSDRAETPNLKIYFQKTDSDLTRIGIALSKNYFKNSVLRNRAKRIVSKTIEDLYNDLPKGLNLVIMPKSGVLTLSSVELGKEILSVKRIFN